MSYDKTGHEVFRVLEIIRITVPNGISGLAIFLARFAKYPYASAISSKSYSGKDELDVLKQIQQDPYINLLPPHVPFPGIDS